MVKLVSCFHIGNERCQAQLNRLHTRRRAIRVDLLAHGDNSLEFGLGAARNSPFDVGWEVFRDMRCGQLASVACCVISRAVTDGGARGKVPVAPRTTMSYLRFCLRGAMLLIGTGLRMDKCLVLMAGARRLSGYERRRVS